MCCKYISNSQTMVCPPVSRDNPRAIASCGLSYVQKENYCVTVLYQSGTSAYRDISC